jgi:hypothetical protein
LTLAVHGHPGITQETRIGFVRSVRVGGISATASFPPDRLATAISRGAISFTFLDHPVFNRFSGLTATTFRRLSEETRIPVETLLVVREVASCDTRRGCPRAGDYEEQDRPATRITRSRRHLELDPQRQVVGEVP